MGDHTETTQIDYDPQTISYQELLDMFWLKHNPQGLRSRQYMSIIFYKNEVEREIAEETKVRESTRRNGPIYTEVVPFKNFYYAETYHQKYYMQLVGPIYKDLRNIYPEVKNFYGSTAAARINGYVKGLGTVEALYNSIDSFGLSEKGKKKLIEIVEDYRR